MGFRVGAGILCVAAIAALPHSANAAFPGENGKIAFVRGGHIWTVNPDGTSRTQITTSGARHGSPRWSPDGTKIVFTAPRANADPAIPNQESDIWVMNADGSNKHQVTDTPGYGFKFGPSWSPDGTRIAYGDGRHIWTIKPDGTDAQRVTRDPTNPDCFHDYGGTIWSPDGTGIATNGHSLCFDHEYPISEIVDATTGATKRTWFTTGADDIEDWSPDSQSLVFGTMGLESGGLGMYTVSLSGGGGGELTDGTYDDGYSGAAWSPDGERIVFARATPYEFDTLLYFIDPDDGSNITPLSTGDAFECCPDWQPIPVNAYPRPKGTEPNVFSLVPAYQACSTSANRTHGPPLQFPACAPPQREPGALTVGTPDANGLPAKSVSWIRLRQLVGNPQTPADEADISLSGTVNDVRLTSDLSDYTGALEARMSLRITDKDNTPNPGGPGAATVQDITYSFPIPCAATADTTIGGDCTFDTTAEAFVPGIAKEGRRAIWELGQVRVHDASGGVFMRQGIFVP